MGVNQEKYDNSFKIVSNASCTTNCLAPLTPGQEKAAKSDDTKKQELEVPLNGILGYTEDQIVSYDLNRDAHFCTFGAGTGIVLSDSFVMLMPGMTMNIATTTEWLI
ncbi:hypothetical protein U0070_024061 [Myodes glareolus]|uniref:glyceraldehyde-3-phosphate dehydrogenase (phosphorylating) n=1 Tax=Myodes glareolus TaxID=447135 RepID=A0AAW0HUK8_MYOGA